MSNAFIIPLLAILALLISFPQLLLSKTKSYPLTYPYRGNFCLPTVATERIAMVMAYLIIWTAFPMTPPGGKFQKKIILTKI